jgi:hypothetical protein
MKIVVVQLLFSMQLNRGSGEGDVSRTKNVSVSLPPPSGTRHTKKVLLRPSKIKKKETLNDDRRHTKI